MKSDSTRGGEGGLQFKGYIKMYTSLDNIQYAILIITYMYFDETKILHFLIKKICIFTFLNVKPRVFYPRSWYWWRKRRTLRPCSPARPPSLPPLLLVQPPPPRHPLRSDHHCNYVYCCTFNKYGKYQATPPPGAQNKICNEYFFIFVIILLFLNSTFSFGFLLYIRRIIQQKHIFSAWVIQKAIIFLFI